MSDTIEIRHLCPLPHRGHATEVHPPATICHGHSQQIHATITDIARLWDSLDDLTTTARSGGNGGGFNSTPPIRLDVLALTDPHTIDADIPNATSILTGIANWIATIRHLTPVAGATAALSLLGIHYPALSDHPHPLVAYSGLQRLHGYLRRLAGEHRHVVAHCQQPHPDPQNDDECGGPIYWTGRASGIIAACSACGDEWTDAVVWLHQQQEELRKAQA